MAVWMVWITSMCFLLVMYCVNVPLILPLPLILRAHPAFLCHRWRKWFRWRGRLQTAWHTWMPTSLCTETWQPEIAWWLKTSLSKLEVVSESFFFPPGPQWSSGMEKEVLINMYTQQHLLQMCFYLYSVTSNEFGCLAEPCSDSFCY